MESAKFITDKKPYMTTPISLQSQTIHHGPNRKDSEARLVHPKRLTLLI